MNIRIVAMASLATMMFTFAETANANCQAIAYPTTGKTGGVAWDDSRAVAETEAVAFCQKHNGSANNTVGKTCKVTDSLCTKSISILDASTGMAELIADTPNDSAK